MVRNKLLLMKPQRERERLCGFSVGKERDFHIGWGCTLSPANVSLHGGKGMGSHMVKIAELSLGTFQSQNTVTLQTPAWVCLSQISSVLAPRPQIFKCFLSFSLKKPSKVNINLNSICAPWIYIYPSSSPILMPSSTENKTEKLIINAKVCNSKMCK